MRSVAKDVARSVVGVSVCVFGTRVSCAKKRLNRSRRHWEGMTRGSKEPCITRNWHFRRVYFPAHYIDVDVFPPRRPAVTLTFNLQNLTRSSFGGLRVIPSKFHQDCSSRSWDICRETSTVRFLSTPDRSSNSAQHHWRSIISCDCRASMEQSSYQRHCINFPTVFQETT